MSDTRADPQYKLRFSEQLRDRITEAAKASGRSINAEIVGRLESSFERANTDTKKDAWHAINRAADIVLIRLFGHALGGPHRLSSASRPNAEILKRIAFDFNVPADQAGKNPYTATERLQALIKEVASVVGNDASEEQVLTVVAIILASNLGTSDLIAEMRTIRETFDFPDPNFG